MNEGDISVENIIEIHDYAIQRWGGLPGMRDESILHHLVQAVKEEHDPVNKTALILHTIATLRPFRDGNGTTAFLAADNQFASYGFSFDTSDGEVYEFVSMVADNQKTLQDVKKWTRRYMRALRP